MRKRLGLKSHLLHHLELTDVSYISGSPNGTRRAMTEREQQRLVNHRLAVIRYAEEVAGQRGPRPGAPAVWIDWPRFLVDLAIIIATSGIAAIAMFG
jgi:hypothetical protein